MKKHISFLISQLCSAQFETEIYMMGNFTTIEEVSNMTY